jgi:hypothetical protein
LEDRPQQPWTTFGIEDGSTKTKTKSNFRINKNQNSKTKRLRKLR